MVHTKGVEFRLYPFFMGYGKSPDFIVVKHGKSPDFMG